MKNKQMLFIALAAFAASTSLSAKEPSEAGAELSNNLKEKAAKVANKLDEVKDSSLAEVENAEEQAAETSKDVATESLEALSDALDSAEASLVSLVSSNDDDES